MKARIRPCRWIAGLFALVLLWATSALAAPALVPGQSATQLPDGRWLLLGGEGGFLAKAQIHDAKSGQTVTLPTGPTTARAHHTASLLADGTVLVLGGLGSDGLIVRGAEVFDPASQRFSGLPDTGLIPRARHSATVLMDGRVLVAGGISERGTTLVEAELWDPASGRPDSASARLLQPRMGHNATMLPTEPVLISGGRDDAGAPVGVSELYLPADQRFSAAQETDLSSPVATAPGVQATLPVTGATGVALDSRIAVRFSKPLRMDSVTTETVTLIGPSGAVAVRAVPAEGGMLLFVTPRVQLTPGAQYTLFISGAADAAGNPLPFTASGFTTRTLSGSPAATSAGASSSNTANGTSSNAAQPQAAPPPLSAAIPAPIAAQTAPSEQWIPGPEQLHGDWRAKRPDSPLQQLPALAAAPGVTALAGQVLLLDGQAAANVTLRVGTHTVVSGADGRFLLQDLPAGSQTLVIDGASASQPGKTYGYFEARVSVEAGQTNALPYTVWLTRIDTQHRVSIPSPTAADVVVTTPFIPGLELHIPKGTVLRDRAGRVVTEVSITPIPIDRAPFPLPTNHVPVYFTIQPGGAHLQGIDAASAQGARLIYPNYRNEAPGTQLSFWNYDPMAKGWYVYGQGKVSADGRRVVPDAGVAIYEFTGAMVSNPSLAPPEGPKECSGAEASDGDPVDCYTGLFLHTRRDLALRDTVPIELTRTYRPRDTISRPFGIGTSHPYAIFLVGDGFPYTYQELILPDGGRIRFNRTSPGTSYADAVYGSVGAPGPFAGAVLKWCSPNCAITGSVWDITLRDGTRYYFPDSYNNANPALGHISGMADRYGSKTTLTRNAAGNLTRITSPNGRWIDFTYDTSNRITSATDIMGRVATYSYDASGRLATATDPEGGVETYSYDASHRMLSVLKPGGQTMVTNVYDANGRVSRQTLADGGVYSFAYTLNASAQVTQTEVTDPRGNVRRVEFNGAGYVVKETRALGKPEQAVTVIERDTASNQILARIDPLGRRTAYTYDAKGNTTSITRLAGTAQAATTTLTYEPQFNQLASVTDPLGRLTQYRHDSLGNLIEVQNPLGQITSASYAPTGLLLSVTDPLGNTTRFAYEGGDLLSITDPLGRVASQFTDAAGRVLARTDPLGNTARTEYDRRDLVTRSTDALGNATAMSYDANRNLKTVVDAKGGTWSYAHDARDRVSSVTDPLGQAESYLYDGLDNLTQHTERNGKTSTHSYDALNRRTQAEYGRGQRGQNLTAPDATVSYSWDAGNRLTQVVDSQGGTLSRSYDGLDRLVGETTPQGSVGYSYDAANRRTGMSPSGQTPIAYAWDNADRLGSISQGSLQTLFTYDNANRRATLTLPNGINASYGWDAAGQLTAITYSLGSTPLGNLSYQYDAAGRRTQVGGSLARMSLPPAVASASYNAANQLTSWAGTAHSYDANGNLSADGQRSYSYDSRNRLTALAGAAAASFKYDAMNRRAEKTIAGATTRFAYDGAQATTELDAGNAVTATLLAGLGLDEVFSRTTAAGTQSLITDALGSTLALADAAGVIQTSYAYDPYGGTTASGAGSDNAIQYTGRENDGTGLYFYRARYYDPGKGRFTQSDPIGLLGGPNVYAYVGGNPISNTDPAGLDWQVTGGFGGLIGAAVGPGLGGFLGGGVNFGINSSGQVFMSVQGSATTGVGAFAGAGVQYGAGYSGPQTCLGDSGWTPSVEGNANLGAGLSKGGSVNVGKDAVAGQVGGRIGVGYGAQVSAGVAMSRQWTWQLPLTSKPQSCACPKQ